MGFIFGVLALLTAPAYAEDGYDLWLRYRPIEASYAKKYRAVATQIVIPGAASPTMVVARDELATGLSGILLRSVPVVTRIGRSGAIVLGTPSNSPIVAQLDMDLRAAGPEGYRLRDMTVNGRKVTVIGGNSDIGVLYGTFAYLRLLQTRQPLTGLDIVSSPRTRLRVLNHWDNLDGTIERGFAGHSIFDWHRLPEWVEPRLTVYARANASVGINGAVLNNVNANATSLTAPYLAKTAAIANVLRPYGIHVFLTARFSAPIEIGGLKTADPLDATVRNWWREKVEEIYRIIPDFGGFLVKANSEGQPGPQDYQRTHADGANMLAENLAPHGGVVMWRAFVYAGGKGDRASQAYNEFVPLDGQFARNVILQIKNGPIDFQPREPVHPLLGALRQTSVGLELQITKEYLGQSTHIAYLAPLWKETLDTDVAAKGPGSTVGRIIDGSLFGQPMTSIAGVANIGTDRNWCGSHFDQANWFAFGRLAWNHELSSETIAEEWWRMTFSNRERILRPIIALMMGSRETVVNYMTPLGLNHQMNGLGNYGPAPWQWTQYSGIDAQGIGVDRSVSGSNSVAQYTGRLTEEYGDVRRTPEKFLLWFHHVPWGFQMSSGRPLWEELVSRYDRGVEDVREMRRTWSQLSHEMDRERYEQVAKFLVIQEREAQWWRNASIAFFQSVSGRPLPSGVVSPPQPLEFYQAWHDPYSPGSPGRTAAPFFWNKMEEDQRERESQPR